MLIIGTVIGAGFASGREIVSFFGTGYISPAVAVVCGLLIAGGSFLFLAMGAKFGATNISEVNHRILGRLHPVADLFLLFNSLVVLAGMLSGLDALGNLFFRLQPVYSIAGGILCGAVVYRGVRGLVHCNSVLIPAVIAVIVAVCAVNLGQTPTELPLRFNLGACLVYAAMNLILASTVLATTDVGLKTAAVCSALAGLIMGTLMLLIILALNARGAGGAMPLLWLALEHPPLFYAMAAVIAAAIFTTMLTAAGGLTDWLAAATGDRKFSVTAVMLAGLILSNLGFEAVVNLLYPVIGFLGVAYIAAALVAVLHRKKKRDGRLVTPAERAAAGRLLRRGRQKRGRPGDQVR